MSASSAVNKIKVEKMPITEIKAAKYNPRKDLKPGDPEFEKLRNSIERWNLVEPLVVNKRTGTLVSGHQRLKVCQALGIKTVQAVVVDLSPEREKLLNISLNKTGSDWDYLKLEELFKEFDPEELTITGFDDDEIKKIADLMGDIPDDVLDNPSQGQPEEDEAGEDQPADEGKFTIYVSFGSKEEAEDWLEQEDFDEKFKDRETVNIHMKG